MNRVKATAMISQAKRTIKIVELLMEGKETAEVLETLNGFVPKVERSLVDYYKVKLK